MPKNCAECKVNDVAKCGTNYKYLLEHEAYYDSVRSDCPLISIPPHGRLIDADAMKKSIHCTDSDEKKLLSPKQLHDVLDGWIDDRPTIIEVEVGEL